ncbi:MAG: peroxiredoxin-like family protein [Actinomycetota bacterium]
MRDEEDRFTPLANVVLVGQGQSDHARDFCEARRAADAFHCTVAPGNEAYRHFGLTRGSWMQVAGPKVWAPGARTFFAPEVHQGRTKGDPMQLAGTFVIDSSGVIRYAHRNRTSADNPSNEDVLAALEAVTSLD